MAKKGYGYFKLLNTLIIEFLFKFDGGNNTNFGVIEWTRCFADPNKAEH